jgi:glucose/arabinose dehydrogenase
VCCLKKKNTATLIFLLATIIVFSALISQRTFAQPQTTYSVQVAFPQLTFNQPVGLFNAPDGSNRLFVIEQAGRIQVFQNAASTAVATVFLDLTDRVLFGGEQGLLGLAFHPNFTSNGYFYVDYVAANPTRTVIARFTVNAANPNLADKGSEFILLEISQPFSNHKGGQIAFGPDGYLYVGMGDGGSGGDPLGNGQNRSTLLGKILRINVNAPSSGRNYSVPADNPFVGNIAGYKEEIYAYGFRNPWRFSFDLVTGQLFVGDVGQDRLEEIDVVQKGKNYGWSLMEGTLPYAGGNLTGLELPIYEYDHTLGIAIVGGYEYHGSAIPALQGAYVYGDYGSGRIWALTLNGTIVASNNLLVASTLTISSFGVDQAGELYVCAFNGKIYRLYATAIPELLPSSGIVIFVVLTIAAVISIKKWKNSWFASPAKGNP